MEEEKEPLIDEEFDEDLEEGNDDDLWNPDLDDDFYDSSSGGAPLSRHNDLLKDLTNFAPYLKDTVNNWLGLTWSETDQKYVRTKSIEPVMTIEGATWCVGVLKTYARNNNIITDIGKEDYIAIMEDEIELIFLNIGTRQEFGVKNNGDVLRVCNEMLHSISLVLMGAGDGKYNKFLSTTVSRHENISQSNPQQQMPIMKKKGVMQKLRDSIVGDTGERT